MTNTTKKNLQDLATEKRWLTWVGKPDGHKPPRKVPYSPGGGKGSSTDATTWGSRAEAEARIKTQYKPLGIGGVGITFGDLGNGTNLCGVDLDTCRNAETGLIDPWALEILEQFGSYTEISPSKTGVKIFFIMTAADVILVQAARGKTKFAGYREGAHPPGIELYLHSRYFTVTDDMLTGSTSELRVVSAQTVIDLVTVTGPAFLAAHGNASAVTPKAPKAPPPPPPPPPPPAADLQDSVPWIMAPTVKFMTVDPDEVRSLDPDAALRRLAPPTPWLLLAALTLLPNDISKDRDAWVCVNHAVRGCNLGGVMTGALNDNDVKANEAAAINWSCRYPGSDRVVEEEKLKIDWSKRDVVKLGWPYIRQMCADAGLNDILMAEAQYEFRDTELLPAPVANLTPKPFAATPFQFVDRIPPREWLYGQELIRKFVSVLGAPGGAGKSAYAVTVALSIATGRSLHHQVSDPVPKHLKVHQRSKVWWYNLEDPHDELQRRIQAAMLHHHIAKGDIQGSLFVDSGRTQPLIIAKRSESGGTIATPIVDLLVTELRLQGVKLLIVDPFVSCHELTENSNDEMNFVMSLWADVADKADCSIWLIHHFRKGGASGDAEAFRGAVAIQGKARSMYTMGAMIADEGRDLGVSDGDRWRYVRHDNAKQNMAPRSDKAVWFKLVGVHLGNRTDDYPDGDEVHTLEAWTPPSPFEGLDWTLAEAVLHSIDDGRDDGGFFNIGRKGERWAGHIVMELTGKTELQVKVILADWGKAGVFKVETYPSPVPARKGKNDAGVKVNWPAVALLKERSPRSAALADEPKIPEMTADDGRDLRCGFR